MTSRITSVLSFLSVLRSRIERYLSALDCLLVRDCALGGLMTVGLEVTCEGAGASIGADMANKRICTVLAWLHFRYDASLQL